MQRSGLHSVAIFVSLAVTAKRTKIADRSSLSPVALTTNFEVPRNVFRIVSAALSVPGNNTFCERIFSLMNAKGEQRGTGHVALIRSEPRRLYNL